MPNNESTDSLSDVSSLSSVDGPEPFNAEDVSDEVANFYQKMSITTTRRLPAKNVQEGTPPYIFETVKKTTRTVISHSLHPPVQMLKRSRLSHASDFMHKASRRDEAGIISSAAASPPQTEIADMHAPMSAPLPAPRGRTKRPIVQVFADEIPGWPRYPDSPPGDVNSDAAISPPAPSMNHATVNGEATPTLSAITSQIASLAPAGDNTNVAAGNQLPVSASAPSVSEITPPNAAVRPSGPFVNADDMHIAACSPAALATASQPPSSASSASPSRPSVRGSQLRYAQILEALEENSASSRP
ncbi:hypothetical protein HYPSUDRAFT_209894 [Hypholoma sublateritium FD-334 SS-4]|uniref:Uncharacterized protein n=1 Tax=Hypholoma sublateritium (strain FD-334 SS-4) TaxID=945553 RepID=A0A0D2N8H2_HYPSF|nr:hypothetical protein HYPSUDRAFT_209894 [Hypholoma sublateritium FD-334 SS-4]